MAESTTKIVMDLLIVNLDSDQGRAWLVHLLRQASERKGDSYGY